MECNGPEYDDFYEKFCPREHRFRRDATEDFLGGMCKTGEKLLDGNIGGSITTFLKTLAQPVFHYLIHSNNDPGQTTTNDKHTHNNNHNHNNNNNNVYKTKNQSN